MSEIKTIYEFSVSIEKEVEKVETKTENGSEVTTKTKVKESVPVYFAFKKPSRVERESVEEHRAAIWSKYVIEKGIVSEAVLLKAYSNSGGILSEQDKKFYTEMRALLATKIKEYQDKPDTEENKSFRESLMKEIMDLRDNIVTFERAQSAFFDNTAESKARVKAIEFIILNFSYFRHDAKNSWEQFFKGDSLERKYDDLDKKDEESDELYNKTKDKLSFVASLYFSLGSNLKKEDIDTFEKEFA